jgi:arginine-tRNA-protein transferase
VKSEVVRLLKTLEHPCGYFAGRVAQNLVIDPLASDLAQLYDVALTRGYRRAGGHIYHPACPRCRACTPTRIPVVEFAPNRSQQRCAKRNADLAIAVLPPQLTDEYHDLYQRYLESRHPGGGMDDADREDFTRFLTSPWSPTRFVTMREGGRLLGVAVTDFTRFGMSAVYTFYEPEAQARSLGTYAILTQIELARHEKLPHVYLGYWIERHPKMGYKANYRPLEILRGARWERLGG